MPVKVGINGFGGSAGTSCERPWKSRDRIRGRQRHYRLQDPGHLLKYDSDPGQPTHKADAHRRQIAVDGKSFHSFQTKDPAEIDWPSVGP